MVDVEAGVLDTIAAQARVDRASLTRDTPLESLQLESLDYVEVIFDLEEKFDVTINYSANETELKSKTVGAIVDMVASVVSDPRNKSA